MTDDIVHEATYPYPPEAVWRALTTREALSAWLMETDFREATVGHRFTFRDKPKKIVGWNGITECEVTEVVPFKRFAFLFGTDQGVTEVTKVTWELEEAPGGTRVRFRHSGFTGFKGWMMRQGMNQGWGGLVRHAIPFVVSRLLAGSVPTREETRLVARKGFRADHHAKRAEAAPRS
ncbi:MAG TPA: SRPBCC domain-containing protein [Candidatus Thermoplasmatota archaeon]|nr:SRPBCC domain-containing protein [Candidatus Thermoplasmatota archaeon]